jgi:hypothetical protein
MSSPTPCTCLLLRKKRLLRPPCANAEGGVRTGGSGCQTGHSRNYLRRPPRRRRDARLRSCAISGAAPTARIAPCPRAAIVRRAARPTSGSARQPPREEPSAGLAPRITPLGCRNRRSWAGRRGQPWRRAPIRRAPPRRRRARRLAHAGIGSPAAAEDCGAGHQLRLCGAAAGWTLSARGRVPRVGRQAWWLALAPRSDSPRAPFAMRAARRTSGSAR